MTILAETIDAVIGGDTLPVKKPNPAPLLAALGALECDLAQGVMVGDSGADTLAARAAGIPVILVTFGYTSTPVQELDNDGIIESFSALPGAIGSSFRFRAIGFSPLPNRASSLR